MALLAADYSLLRLLRHAAFERRGNRWRFGSKTISEAVVARLIANGRVEIFGDRVRLIVPAPIGAAIP